MDNEDLATLKYVLEKLINKNRIGGNHIEIIQLRHWGLTKKAEKYAINKFLLKAKNSDNNKELAVHPHNMKEVYRIINEVKDVSQL